MVFINSLILEDYNPGRGAILIACDNNKYLKPRRGDIFSFCYLKGKTAGIEEILKHGWTGID
jgi:hypothetical protein